MTPIVLHHGLFGFSEIGIGKLKLSYFHRIDRAIAERGHPVILSRVHPTGPIERRAAELKETILKQLAILKCSDQRVVIFAHSLGGLDSRYMISKLGMAERVAALVTVCTPHRGSSYADWCMHHLGNRLKGVQLLRFMRLDMRAISDLTRMSCSAFNGRTPDMPQVRYFSVTGNQKRSKVAPLLFHSSKIVTEEEGDNDGVVSVRSGIWGEHLGSWPADHLHVLNRKWVPELRKDAMGDVSQRYLQILDHLHQNGLCVSQPGAARHFT
jgi:triacylglycerol lipase